MYIGDDKKDVKVDDKNINLTMPHFKGLLEKLIIPLSVLNCNKCYVYIPTDNQKKAIQKI